MRRGSPRRRHGASGPGRSPAVGRRRACRSAWARSRAALLQAAGRPRRAALRPSPGQGAAPASARRREATASAPRQSRAPPRQEPPEGRDCVRRAKPRRRMPRQPPAAPRQAMMAARSQGRNKARCPPPSARAATAATARARRQSSPQAIAAARGEARRTPPAAPLRLRSRNRPTPWAEFRVKAPETQRYRRDVLLVPAHVPAHIDVPGEPC